MRRRWVSLGLGVALAVAGAAQAGALDEYVQRPDPGYGWLLYHKEPGWLADYYHLRLSSQYWLDFESVDRTLWVHQLRGAVPSPVFCGTAARSSRTAVLMISGGRNRPDSELSRHAPAEAGALAVRFCRPLFELKQVPNQPLTFAGEAEVRKEDALLAFSVDRYLRGTTGDWPAHLAMVKAVVKAMDAVQEFSRSRDDWPDIEDFVLIGTSKRGWAAWLAAAADTRVRALIPVSIDVLNVRAQLEHQLRAYGDYSPALNDYKAFDIGCRLGGERGDALLHLIDPLSYRERLDLPKLIVNSAGDEFFLPDSWQFYYRQLPGLTSLLYTVNTDHKQGRGRDHLRLFEQAVNWVDDVLAGRAPPRLEWERHGDELVVTVSEPPRRVRLWTADNPDARDFRLETLGPVWRSEPLAPQADGRYRVRLTAPARGWRAALVEATFGGWRRSTRQIYTTGVYVLPETMPFKGLACSSSGPEAPPGAPAVRQD